MACDIIGHGPALILLHPFPFDHRFWRLTAQAMADRAQVIVPDMRGFGDASNIRAPFSVTDLADDIVALMDSLKLRQATVCGLSMGGYVALALAANYPERLSGLILADTKASPDSPEARAARDEAITLVKTQGVTAYVEKQLPRLVAPSASVALRSEVARLAAQRANTVVAGLEALRDRPDRRPDLARIACPVLIIVGSEDALTPPNEACAMAAAVPGVTLVEIPGAGHLASLEAPDAFNQAVAGFLGTIPPPRISEPGP